MNRMWVRFGLIFGLFALLGPILLVTLGFLSLQAGVLRAFIRSELNVDGGLIDQMTEYFQAHGSWEGVETIISVYDNLLPPISNDTHFELYFMDEDRNVLYGSEAAQAVLARDDDAHEVLAITIRGSIRGYLSIVQLNRQLPANDPSQPRPFLVSQVSGALTSLGIFSAVFGLMAGLVVSRALARPLGQLAETARRLGKRDFTARAEVKGSDELREVAKAFNDMVHDLDQAEILRRNLVADVAHELRTPLTVLQANLQALADGIYPLSTDEIEKLLHQTELLNRLVGELRELSLAEAHQLPLKRHIIDLSELLQRIADTFQTAATQQAVELIVDTPPIIMVWVDDGRIRQVINNLMDNALKHTPAQGEIRLTLTEELGNVLIQVKDTGSGISPEHLPYVFERFYRADKSRSRETGGTGLGLAIAKAIIELHNGQITVESTGIAGEGTTFTLRFPIGIPYS